MISRPMLRVQRARRLVRQNDPGIVHQRPRDGHTLLLAAGELAGLVVLAAGQAHREQAPSSPARVARAAGVIGVQQRQLDVFDARWYARAD